MFDPRPNLQDLISAHHAAQTPVCALTAIGEATLAARHFVLTLRDLTPEDRYYLLASVLVNVAGPNEGDTYSLRIMSRPTRDPEVA